MMFINSIFLPKNLSDQTMPEGASGNIGSFSHLFSNVFRIVKDEQDGSVPFKLTELGAENGTETQNELLNVALFSDNKITLDNQNISSIIKAFLSKLNSTETKEISARNNKSLENKNIPKYFSLNKNDLISEIKNIVETLKKGDVKNLENVSISLIANGQLIQINPTTKDFAKLENWVSTQLETNNDFELLVKSGGQKLFVDVEPLQTQTVKSISPVEIVIPNSIVDIASENVSVETKNSAITASIINTKPEVKGDSKPRLTGLKTTAQDTNIKNEKNEYVAEQKPIVKISGEVKYIPNETTKLFPKAAGLETLSEISELQKVQSTSQKIVDGNNSVSNSNLKENAISEFQNQIKIKEQSGSSSTKSLIDSIHQNIKQSKVFKNSDVEIKTLTADKNIKLENSKTVLTTIKDVNVKELNKSENKINFRANQKLSSVSISKSDVKEKITLNELIEKTNVKGVEVKADNTVKTINNSNPKNLNELQTETTTLKAGTIKNQSQILNEVSKKNLSTPFEIKQPQIKKSEITNSVKADNVSSKTVKENIVAAKTENQIKYSETAKINITTKTQAQQELFADGHLDGKEDLAVIKSAPIKTTYNNSISTKDKIELEKNNLTQNKILEVEIPKVKSEQNTTATTIKIIPSELKSELTTASEKTKLVVNDVLKAETDNNNPIKESPKEFIKEVVLDTSKKVAPSDIKTEFKKVDLKPGTDMVEENSKNLSENKAVKEVAKEGVKEIFRENVKENIPFKTKTTEINKTFVKADSDNTFEKSTAAIKEKNTIENLKSSVKEFANKEVKTENINRTQFENKNTKVDFIQRRVYSQIPPLEIFTDAGETKNINNNILSAELSKTENIKTIAEPVKSSPNQIEQKPKIEKQVWVKVSLEKNDNELLSDARKSTPQQNKITIDPNNEGMKNNSEQNNFSEKDTRDYSKLKPQTVSAESSLTTEVKSVFHNQSTSNQQDISSNIKPEIKIEHTPYKSALNTEETKFTSRASEMIEKVKVISSGEMIREIHKVFESGEKQSIVLRLVPKELGAVKVMLDTIDNMLTAKVEVENETVGHIVRNNVDQLKQNLLQSGVNVSSINISFQNSEQKQHGFNNHKRKNSEYQQNIETEDIDETILAKKMGYNTYEYLA